MHRRQQVFEFITRLREKDLALAVVDKFLQIQSYLLGIAVIVHRVRHIDTHLFAHTEVVLGTQTGVQNNGGILQRIDVLLTKLARRESFNMNELIEITMNIVL